MCCSLISYLFFSAVLTNLAFCYELSGKLDQALVLLEEAVTISKRELPPSHPDLAHGKIFVTLKKYLASNIHNYVCASLVYALSDLIFDVLVFQR